MAATGESRSLYGPNVSHAHSLNTRHCAWAKTASGVAHMDRPLLGKITSASMPSRAWSRRRSRGSAPAFWRSMSSPSSSCTRRRSGRCPSDTRHITPLASVITRGMRSRYFLSMRSAHSVDGSLAWQSAEMIRYRFGSSGRAVRVQPA